MTKPKLPSPITRPDHLELDRRLQRDAALQRVRALAHDARTLVAYDGHSSPPDWRPFVAKLADELACMIERSS